MMVNVPIKRNTSGMRSSFKYLQRLIFPQTTVSTVAAEKVIIAISTERLAIQRIRLMTEAKSFNDVLTFRRWE